MFIAVGVEVFILESLFQLIGHPTLTRAETARSYEKIYVSKLDHA
jgi:hypothetical protein